MADKLKEYSPDAFSDPNKTFLDPAVGSGNLLIEVLIRKLPYAPTPYRALATVYGCDIFQDNVKECRLRLIKVIVRWCDKNKITLREKDKVKLIKLAYRNIVCTPLRTYPKGSLDYLSLPQNRTFNTALKNNRAEAMRKAIKNGGLLNTVKI